jgi:hypothetical protein
MKGPGHGRQRRQGEAPAKGDGISPDDVAASFYHSLGIDAGKEYRTPTGRPIVIVRELFPLIPGRAGCVVAGL